MRAIPICIAALALWPDPGLAGTWHWKGIEVIGLESQSPDELRALIPIEKGAPYQEDSNTWAEWCAALIPKFELAYASCSAVRYSDFKAYLTVDVVEKGFEYRIAFRPEPTEEVSLGDKDLRETIGALKEREWELFNQGKPPIDEWTGDHLSYSDPLLQTYVQRLLTLTPPFRDNLFEVIGRDRDVSDRMLAADLLNWGGETTQSVLKASEFLDDPNPGVRNQLARFMMFPIKDVQDEVTLRIVVKRLAILLERPAHGDRNKALYNLLAIAESAPSLRPIIKECAGKQVATLARTSILENIIEPARELLKRIGE